MTSITAATSALIKATAARPHNVACRDWVLGVSLSAGLGPSTRSRTPARLSTSAFHRASRSSTACRLVEPFEIGWQLRRCRHGRSFDQHGNDPHVATEGGSYLETDEIVGIVKPPSAVPVGAREPLPAYDSEQHIAGANGLLEDVHEVDAGFDVRDVHEDRGRAETRPQVVEEPAGMAGTVFTPVADEDAGRDASSR